MTVTKDNRESDGALWPIILITTLFFFSGMLNSLNDILIPQFKKAFSLTDFQSGMVQSAFYAGYFLLALPAGFLMRRFGYKTALVTGLSIFAIGTFLFYPAAEVQKYLPFLAALFIIASGLAFLETSINPLMTILGDPRGAPFRLNLAQAFNPLGSLAGIWIGRQFILSGVEAAQARLGSASPEILHDFYVREARAVQMPYLIIGCIIVAWVFLVAFSKFPKAVSTGTQRREEPELSIGEAIGGLFKHKQLLAGIVAQFFYVGAQVGIWSYTIKYAQAEAHQTDKAAAIYLIYNYVAFTVGRFSGTALMRIVSPTKILSLFALCNIVLASVAAVVGGQSGLYAMVAASFFMSIMYPTIFAVSVKNLGPLTKTGSSFLVMSIIGGAVLTPLMGYVSDTTHLIRLSILVPAACFVILAIFGATSKLDTSKSLAEKAGS